MCVAPVLCASGGQARPLTEQQQPVCGFIGQPLLLQLLLDLLVGLSLRLLIDALILRLAVAQTPHVSR